MNINIYICLLTLLTAGLVGCSKEEVGSTTDTPLTPIRLSAEIAASMETKTQGTDGFPNEGKISVIAAKHTQGATTWADLHLDNKPAATTSTGATYDFNWLPTGSDQLTPPYYWPFNPEEKLVFVAFGPTGLTHSQGSKTSLDIQLKKDKDMEDVIYTRPTEPKNKESQNGKVDLGEFQHALGKVRIVIKAINTKDEDVVTDQFKVKSIKVKTKATTATLNLTNGTLANQEASDYEEFDLLAKETALNKSGGITVEQNVLPQSDNITYIGLTLTDGILEYGKNGNDSNDKSSFGYTLSNFTLENGSKLSFEAGKITVLTFKIKIKDVSTGDGDDTTIILKGDLKDWECQGNFEVGIE